MGNPADRPARPRGRVPSELEQRHLRQLYDLRQCARASEREARQALAGFVSELRRDGVMVDSAEVKRALGE